MSLKTYHQKRDFGRTPEPAGGRTTSPGEKRLYVIQKHAASRLHYDLRLEEGGVLKSWAVPKGPSLDPQEKRLAVQVEDHPIEYGEFEGIIPEGEYGGGTVLLWDQGRWVPEGDPEKGLRQGKLKFKLDGKKLRGGWTLVRLRRQEGDGQKPNWLLIKEQDETAAPQSKRDILKERPESVASRRRIEDIAKAQDRVWHSNRHGGSIDNKGVADIEGVKQAQLPDIMPFQLATLTNEPPMGDEWLHEIKLDGFRMQCRIDNGTAGLFTRTGQDWTARFTAIAAASAGLPVKTAVLDGEIVALQPDGRSSFHLLQQALSEGDTDRLVYYVFDLLYLDGYDVSPAPLEVRKHTLKQVLDRAHDQAAIVRYSDHVVGGGAAFYKEACRLGLEGMISKRRHAPSRPGRGGDWLKVKCVQRQEFIVGGFTEPSGSRVGLGALLLGVYTDGHFQYTGRVGTGFNDRLLAQLRARLDRLRQERSPYQEKVPGSTRDVTWVRPELVVEIAFSEWTADGVLRHPSFQGIREDKRPQEVHRERPNPLTHRATVKSPGRTQVPTQPKTPVKDEKAEIAGITLTHPTRILYPEQGLTKRDLAMYYEKIADWILPHIAGRPLMVVRCPEGQGKECFYQKHANEMVPDAVKAAAVREESGKVARYLMVDDASGLIALVQMGALELHVWGARADRIEKPDRMVFDLDPDEGLPWSRVVEAALLLKDRLAQTGLASWVKTTGGKGLHVVVPLSGKPTWEDVKGFSQAVAEQLSREAPDRYTSKMSKAGRTGKIFIDYLRNSRGATAVAAYSTRAHPGATVSVPIDWKELNKPDVRKFSIATVVRRLKTKADPWKEFWQTRQSITAAAKRRVGF
ncbi:MAG TPA: DNA ligase D [Nitrospiraceae bacterium]|nr:DNA ligase D [Nitrospiraceae bacterium]